MRKLIKNKKAPDTNEMIFLCYVKKRVLSSRKDYCWWWCKLYVSFSGDYYLVRRESYNDTITEKISETEAKSLLARFRYDIFEQRFGDKETDNLL